MGQFALVNVLVLTEKIASDCVLQKRVPNRFQPFKVDGIIAIAHCERLKDEGRTGSWVGVQLWLLVKAERGLRIDARPGDDSRDLGGNSFN